MQARADFFAFGMTEEQCAPRRGSEIYLAPGVTHDTGGRVTSDTQNHVAQLMSDEVPQNHPVVQLLPASDFLGAVAEHVG